MFLSLIFNLYQPTSHPVSLDALRMRPSPTPAKSTGPSPESAHLFRVQQHEEMTESGCILKSCDRHLLTVLCHPQTSTPTISKHLRQYQVLLGPQLAWTVMGSVAITTSLGL